MKPKRCECCGAPLRGNACAYCGTEFDIADANASPAVKHSIDTSHVYATGEKDNQNILTDDDLGISNADNLEASDDNDQLGLKIGFAIAVGVLFVIGLGYVISHYVGHVSNAVAVEGLAILKIGFKCLVVASSVWTALGIMKAVFGPEEVRYDAIHYARLGSILSGIGIIGLCLVG